MRTTSSLFLLCAFARARPPVYLSPYCFHPTRNRNFLKQKILSKIPRYIEYRRIFAYICPFFALSEYNCTPSERKKDILELSQQSFLRIALVCNFPFRIFRVSLQIHTPTGTETSLIGFKIPY